MTSSQRPSTRTFQTSRQVEADIPEKKERRKLKLPKKNLSALIIVILLGVSIFLFIQYRSAQDKLAGPDKLNAKYINNLKKMILLPTGESPTVATVKDVSKLKGQTFFADAQNGDKVFIYTKAKKVFLYRPSTNMIINVQPVGN